MLLNVLVASSGGGQSRLGGFIQRGIRVFRQVIRVESPPGPGAGFPQNQLSRVVPQTLGGNVLAAVRQGTKSILANYLARDQIHNLAAEMRRRYAVRLMSGSARFYTGLGNKIAIFSFVGISVAVNNQAHQGQRDGCDPVADVVQDLFKNEPEERASCISGNVFASDEEAQLLVVGHVSLSAEDDVTILSEEDNFEDDFEVIPEEEENELRLLSWPEAEESSSCDAETEIRELVVLQAQQNAELHNIVEKLCQENAALMKIIHCQALDDDYLRRKLCRIQEIVDAQGKELLMLRKTAGNLTETELLKPVLSQREVSQMHTCGGKGVGRGPGVSGAPSNADHADERVPDTVIHSEIDRERLRAEGGRVRGLKIHRKKRMKNV